MYPKVVPVAVKEPVAVTTVHNFTSDKLRTSLQVSGFQAGQSKTLPSL
jgi:hypothetical protein